MQIAIYAWDHAPSSHYRAYQPMYALVEAGHHVWVRPTLEDLDAAPPPCDVAYIARHKGPAAERLVARLRAQGSAVVWDCDDDVISTRIGGDAEERALVEATRRIIDLADLVTTTTETLAERLRAQGARTVRTVPNFLPPSTLSVPADEHDGVVVGWIAWIDHQRDWDRLGLRGPFTDLLAAHPELRVESVGPVDLGLASERYVRTEPQPFERLGEALARFDIGIAPLAADFVPNRSRSNIKLKEYAAAGVPWLASPVGPYLGLDESAGGRLVADGDWFAETSRLVTDARARRKLAKRGRKWVRDQELAANVFVWEEMLYTAREIADEQRSLAR